MLLSRCVLLSFDRRARNRWFRCGRRVVAGSSFISHASVLFPWFSWLSRSSRSSRSPGLKRRWGSVFSQSCFRRRRLGCASTSGFGLFIVKLEALVATREKIRHRHTGETIETPVLLLTFRSMIVVRDRDLETRRDVQHQRLHSQCSLALCGGPDA